jgi:hypothetical protein
LNCKDAVETPLPGAKNERGEQRPAKRLKAEAEAAQLLPVAERPKMISRNAAEEDTDSPEYNPYGHTSIVIKASSYGEGDVDAPKVLSQRGGGRIAKEGSLAVI